MPCPAGLRHDRVMWLSGMMWVGLTYAFWHFGSRLPGVPPPTEGVFRIKQVRQRQRRRQRDSVHVVQRCVRHVDM